MDYLLTLPPVGQRRGILMLRGPNSWLLGLVTGIMKADMELLLKLTGEWRN